MDPLLFLAIGAAISLVIFTAGGVLVALMWLVYRMEAEEIMDVTEDGNNKQEDGK